MIGHTCILNASEINWEMNYRGTPPFVDKLGRTKGFQVVKTLKIIKVVEIVKVVSCEMTYRREFRLRRASSYASGFVLAAFAFIAATLRLEYSRSSRASCALFSNCSNLTLELLALCRASTCNSASCRCLAFSSPDLQGGRSVFFPSGEVGRKQDLRLCLFHDDSVHSGWVKNRVQSIGKFIHDIDSGRISRFVVITDITESSAGTSTATVYSTGFIKLWWRHSHSRDRMVIGC